MWGWPRQPSDFYFLPALAQVLQFDQIASCLGGVFVAVPRSEASPSSPPSSSPLPWSSGPGSGGSTAAAPVVSAFWHSFAFSTTEGRKHTNRGLPAPVVRRAVERIRRDLLLKEKEQKKEKKMEADAAATTATASKMGEGEEEEEQEEKGQEQEQEQGGDHGEEAQGQKGRIPGEGDESSGGAGGGAPAAAAREDGEAAAGSAVAPQEQEPASGEGNAPAETAVAAAAAAAAVEGELAAAESGQAGGKGGGGSGDDDDDDDAPPAASAAPSPPTGEGEGSSGAALAPAPAPAPAPSPATAPAPATTAPAAADSEEQGVGEEEEEEEEVRDSCGDEKQPALSSVVTAEGNEGNLLGAAPCLPLQLVTVELSKARAGLGLSDEWVSRVERQCGERRQKQVRQELVGAWVPRNVEKGCRCWGQREGRGGGRCVTHTCLQDGRFDLKGSVLASASRSRPRGGGCMVGF